MVSKVEHFYAPVCFYLHYHPSTLYSIIIIIIIISEARLLRQYRPRASSRRRKPLPLAYELVYYGWLAG